jgi:cytochrome bd-type quinol oxidase subunit 2
MSQGWYHFWVLLHLLGVAAFLISHGGSMFVLFRIRTLGGNRDKIEDLLAFSGETVVPMYASLALLIVAGVIVGAAGKWFHYWWIWAAIGVLVVTSGLMTVTARPYVRRVKAACAVRPSGVPRASDEELGELLSGPAPTVVTAIGVVGLVVIFYLMIFKPGF